MATVREICTEALREIGAIALEEAPTAAEIQTAFTKLNDMIEAWNTERLTVYAIIKEVFPIVAGQASYTMGPGGDWDTVRPLKITDAYSRDSQGNDYPIDLINYDTFSAILPKYVQSPLAQVLYNDNQFPLCNINPWPIWSSASYSAVIWSWQAVANFTSLGQTVTLPPAYNRAIKYNLAVECGPQFGRTITSDLRMLSDSSKAQLKRLNTDILQMGFDNFLLKRPNGWNWQAQFYGGQ